MVNVYSTNPSNQRYKEITIEVGNISLDDLEAIFIEVGARKQKAISNDVHISAVKKLYLFQDYPRMHVLGNFDTNKKTWQFIIHIDVIPHNGKGTVETEKQLLRQYPDPKNLLREEILKPFTESITSRIYAKGGYAHFTGPKI